MTTQTTTDAEYHEWVRRLADYPLVGERVIFGDGNRRVRGAVARRDDAHITVVHGVDGREITFTRADWQKRVWRTGNIVPLDHLPPLPDLADEEIGQLIHTISRARDHEEQHVWTFDGPVEGIRICGFCRHQLDDDYQGHLADCEGEVLRRLHGKLMIYFQERNGDNRRQRDRKGQEGR